MRLIRFQVTNFRSVIDSGWIETGGLTALVGVNESGKTNLLLPLWKLNPAREGEIRPTSDYPKSIYATVRETPDRFRFVTAEFDSEDIADALAKLSGAPRDMLNVVQVARYYDESYSVEFPNFESRGEVDAAVIKDLVEGVAGDIEAISPLPVEHAIKREILGGLSDAVPHEADTLTADEIEKIIADLTAIMPVHPVTTSPILARLRRLIENIRLEHKKISTLSPSENERVHQYVVDNIPKFVYYSNYGNLDSEIYLPHVVENLKRKDLGARESAKARTLRVLFRFVRLEPEEVLELGRDFRNEKAERPTDKEIAKIATKKRERTILLNSAGTELSKRFRDWWRQGGYAFEFQSDGDHFRIWVSDSRRPEKVELEDRSTGLQWFLSFFLVFLVESREGHRDAVLLLDEPGLSLHPLAQKDLSAFFESLASTNQIIYTTHSPFMVDADVLDRARKVYMAADGSTKASADLRRTSEDPRKSGATYAIHSALNLIVAESILYECHPIIVESPSEQHYLATIKSLLIGGRRLNPKREIVFPATHGARNAKIVASILGARDDAPPYVLLNGDEGGGKTADELRKGLYQTAKHRILTTNEFVGFKDSGVEDLFPAEFMANVVDRWARQAEVQFSEVFQSGRPIGPQIEAWASAQEVILPEGWKTDIARQVRKRALSAGIARFGPVLDKWSALFAKLLSDD
jgi:energy-coupling factor transporter ATP-binding protein EcfA2